MSELSSLVDKLRGKVGLQAVLGLGGAAALLLVLAVIGAIKVGGSGGQKTAAKAAAGGAQTQVNSGVQAGAPSSATSSTATPYGGGAVPASGGSTGAAAPASGTQAGGTTRGTLVSTAGATRAGVTASTIKVGIHAPVTLDGAPLSIAADAIEGIKSYIAAINQAGGVNGRTIDYQIADDRYTVDGGKQAANQLVNDYKPFIISGTLGIDQVYQVATAAHAAGIPYMAAGGPDAASDIFRNLGMYEIAGTYDMHLSKLADFLGTEVKKLGSVYFNKTKVGVSVLDSPYIRPSVNVFKDNLARNGLSLVQAVTIQKPTQQTDYSAQIQQLKDAGVQIFVPMQDPITTGREVAQCKTQGCTWTYSFSDFAHDGDTDLALMQGEWSKPGAQVEGLSSACYYQAQNANDPKFCAAMASAHQIWVQQHGGGGKGEVDWQQHGSGGSAGYQVDHFFLKALKDIGTDPTREKFLAALNAYNGYDDLVTGPITELNQPDHMHGVTAMVVLQAGVGHYNQLTPGLVDQF